MWQLTQAFGTHDVQHSHILLTYRPWLNRLCVCVCETEGTAKSHCWSSVSTNIYIYVYLYIIYIYYILSIYIHTYYKHYFGASASFGQSHITDHHGQFSLVTVSICHQLSGCCSVVSVSQRCPGKPPPQDWGPLLVGSHAPWPKFYKLNEGVSENGLHLPNVHLKSFIGKIWKHDDTPMDLGDTLVSDKPTVETKATSL